MVPDEWSRQFEGTALRIVERLHEGEARGEIAGPVDEVHGWAIMEMTMFPGLRYGVQDGSRPLDEGCGHRQRTDPQRPCLDGTARGG